MEIQTEGVTQLLEKKYAGWVLVAATLVFLMLNSGVVIRMQHEDSFCYVSLGGFSIVLVHLLLISV